MHNVSLSRRKAVLAEFNYYGATKDMLPHRFTSQEISLEGLGWGKNRPCTPAPAPDE
jgi:hypothetical protein